jgi:hypothetical protein
MDTRKPDLIYARPIHVTEYSTLPEVDGRTHSIPLIRQSYVGLEYLTRIDDAGEESNVAPEKHSTQRRQWWKRYWVLILIVAIIVTGGVIGGAVAGVLASINRGDVAAAPSATISSM